MEGAYSAPCAANPLQLKVAIHRLIFEPPYAN